MSRFQTTFSVVGPIRPGTTPIHDASGSSSGPLAANRQLARPLTTCAHGCSATSSWRHPPTVDVTGCAGGYWAAPTSTRSCAWRRSTSSPLSRRVRRPRHIGRVVGSEKIRFPKVKASAGPSSPLRGGLERRALGGSSISTPAGDRGAGGAALSTYQEKRMLVRFHTPSHPHS